ncbi:hypothetical protein I4699_00690 [Xanthomonas hortorum pv. carotae]|nr:hypothetical protein [Xanthomonas hortorum pv. carotae]
MSSMRTWPPRARTALLSTAQARLDARSVQAQAPATPINIGACCVAGRLACTCAQALATSLLGMRGVDQATAIQPHHSASRATPRVRRVEADKVPKTGMA